MKQCMKRELKTGLKRVRKTILHTFLVLFGAFQFPFFLKKSVGWESLQVSSSPCGPGITLLGGGTGLIAERGPKAVSHIKLEY